MIRLAFLLVLALAFEAGAQVFPAPGPGHLPWTAGGVFTRSTGLQTNTTELARFVALSGSGAYATDRAAVASHATTARDAWPYTITAGAWESDSGRCEPVGSNQVGSEFEISFAATDVWAMVLSAYLEGGTTSLYSAARTRLLELTQITDFEASDLSGANQCILDLGSAAPHIVEAAFLLGNAGYVGWTLADRVQLANWLAAEVFPLVSWGIDSRKNNWGIVTFAGALSIAAYADGGIALLTKHNGSTISPAAYLSAAPTPLAKWLSTTAGNQLDSDCQAAGQVFGLRTHGGFPDELRRTTGGGSNTANCPQTSLAFACSGPTTCSLPDAKFYSQKTTNGLAHVCEIMRRVTGSGATCFDLTTHGGNDEALYDAAQFATGSTFTSFAVDDAAQGYRYVAGEYYADAALLAAVDDGSVSVRGGRDFAYTKITHAPQVAYVAGGGWLAPPANGVEARAVELAGQGVDVCGEPWNGPETATGGVAGNSHDFASSNNTYECYGRGANYWAWIPEFDWTVVSTSSWPGWGAENYVLKENGASFFTGKKTSAFPAGNITVSWRYHVQFSKGNFERASESCDANPNNTRRTKLSEAFWTNVLDTDPITAGNQSSYSQFQFEEPQVSAANCPHSSVHTLPFEAGWDTGPGSLTADANRNVSPAIYVHDCDDKPCAIEMRIRGFVTTGQDINIRVRVTSLENGTVGEADVGTYDLPGVGTPYFSDGWGGDFFHSGTGDWVFGYALQAIWPDANAEYWIGPAKELTPN